MSPPSAHSSLLKPGQIEALPRIGLRARHAVEGFLAGLHRGRRFGWNMEFAGHREYVPGDDLRTLDWKAWGRTDRYYIKRYEEETSLRVTLCLDRSGSMGYGSGKRSKLDFAKELLAALAYLVVRQKDQAGLATWAGLLDDFLPPASAMPHLFRIWQELEEVGAEGEADCEGVMRQLASRLPRRGMLVLVTDALLPLDSLHRGLVHFGARKFDIVVIQVLDTTEREFPFRGPYRFIDHETDQPLEADGTTIRAEYLEALHAHQDAVVRVCREVHADYHLFDSSMAPEEALGVLLARRRVRRG